MKSEPNPRAQVGDSCIFCKIVKGEIPAYKVHETETLLAFLDIFPVQPGHILIIPKKHYLMMDITPDAVIADIFVEAKKLMKSLKKAMQADYVSLSVVGKDVPHFHVHLIPRFFDDTLKSWPIKKYKDGEKEIIAEKIKEAVK